jgi:hypothetical protein
MQSFSTPAGSPEPQRPTPRAEEYTQTAARAYPTPRPTFDLVAPFLTIPRLRFQRSASEQAHTVPINHVPSVGSTSQTSPVIHSSQPPLLAEAPAELVSAHLTLQSILNIALVPYQ